jgi:tRNA pseudouridine55 synthase
VDKPAGPTSHDVVHVARRALAERRIGHAGTLDPPASGLLVVLVGRATRLARFVGMLPKAYAGTLRFGWETSTDDATGAVAGELEGGWRALDQARIASAFTQVQQQPLQVPPAVSAKKVDGERAYRRVRRGEATELPGVPVMIHDWRLLECDLGQGVVSFEVLCSSGTYVRAIARDVGRALGTRAHLLALRRTAIGDWTVGDAAGMDALVPERAPALLRPMAEAVQHLPAVILPHAEAARLCQGQRIEAGGYASGAVAVFDSTGLIAVAESRAGVLHPDVVLAA